MEAFSEQLLKLTQLFGTLHTDYTKETSELWAENMALKSTKTLLEAQNNILIAQVEALRRELATLKQQTNSVAEEQRVVVEEIDRELVDLTQQEVVVEQEVVIVQEEGPVNVEEQPEVVLVEQEAVVEAQPPRPNIIHKNRSFQKWCKKLGIDDKDTQCRVVQKGFTCYFDIEKNNNGSYILRSKLFEERDLNIISFSPSDAVQKFRRALKDMGKAYANRRTFDANGWDLLEILGTSSEDNSDMWVKIGDDTVWGIHWDTSVGEWVSN